jgi:hypothetical protein
MLMEIWAGAAGTQHNKPMVTATQARTLILDIIPPRFIVLGVGLVVSQVRSFILGNTAPASYHGPIMSGLLYSE